MTVTLTIVDDTAIELNPKYANAYYGRGILKKNKFNDTQGAIEDFRKAIQIYRQTKESTYLQRALDNLKALGASE